MSLAIALPLAATADGDVTTSVDRLQQALIEVGSDPAASYAQRHDRLDGIVRETHDLHHIARLVAGRYWRQWDEAQQERFEAIFARLNVALYAGRFHSLSQSSFQIIGESPQPRGVIQVSSTFAPPDRDPVRFDFLLREASGRWRIVNIVVDGVSDLALRRSETARTVEQGGLEAILADMEDEIGRLSGGEIN